MPRKPLANKRSEAMFWFDNAIRLQAQPVVHSAFVDASRRHAALISAMRPAQYKIERDRILQEGRVNA